VTAEIRRLGSQIDKRFAAVEKRIADLDVADEDEDDDDDDEDEDDDDDDEEEEAPPRRAKR
jgi:TATA-binding protein-associated factor Taf7